MRWAELPWVKLSGFTVPLDMRCKRSFPNRSRSLQGCIHVPGFQEVPLLRRVYINYPDLVLNFIDTVEF
jgi:hypothetical protein